MAVITRYVATLNIQCITENDPPIPMGVRRKNTVANIVVGAANIPALVEKVTKHLAIVDNSLIDE